MKIRKYLSHFRVRNTQWQPTTSRHYCMHSVLEVSQTAVSDFTRRLLQRNDYFLRVHLIFCNQKLDGSYMSTDFQFASSGHHEEGILLTSYSKTRANQKYRVKLPLHLQPLPAFFFLVQNVMCCQCQMNSR